MSTTDTFGKWLKQRRKALDLTQREVADRIGCAEVTLRKIENEACRPSKQIAERLADVFGVAEDERVDFVRLARRVAATYPPPTQAPSSSAAGNLPPPMTGFIGRTQELAYLGERLTDPNCRLLTLVGPGGIGKTSLAVEAARRCATTFSDGVYFVSLAPVGQIDALASTIGSALHFPFAGSQAPAAQLINYFRQKSILLVMDNFEHLLGAVPLLSQLLTEVPQLKIMVTSRERLSMAAEWVFYVDGMRYPGADDPYRPEAHDALQFFIQSARQIRPDYALNADDAAVIRICQLVHGMPLGILLAAAWVGVLSVTDIAHELETNRDFLAVDSLDVPDRQRSLRAAFEHSWELLNEQEREVFKVLSVFHGGFTRDAAQHIALASPTILRSLVNKSLLRWDSTTGRYEIHELLRQYGEDHLRAIPARYEQICAAHCNYYAQHMKQQLKALFSPRQAAVLSEIGVEFSNVLQAWNYALDRRLVEAIDAMALSFQYYCDLRRPRMEGGDLFARAAAALQMAVPDRQTEIVRGHMLAQQAYFTIGLREQTLRAKALAETSLAILRLYHCPEETVIAWGWLALVLGLELQQFRDGELAAREGLRIAQAHNVIWGRGPCYLQLTRCLRAQGQIEEAEQVAEEARRFGETTGNVYLMAAAIRELGRASLEQGNVAEAETLLEESYRLYAELEGGRFPFNSANTCLELGKLALRMQNHEKAGLWLSHALNNHHKAGRGGREIQDTLCTVAQLLAELGQVSKALTVVYWVQQQADDDYIRVLAAALISRLQTMSLSEGAIEAAPLNIINDLEKFITVKPFGS